MVTARAPQRVRQFVALLRSTWEAYEHDHARFFAAAMIYYAFVSLEPLLLLLVAALGLLLGNFAFAAGMEQQVLRFVESSFGSDLTRTIEKGLDSLQRASVLATVVGLVGVMAAASVLFHELRESFQEIWNQPPEAVSWSPVVMAKRSFLDHVIAFATMGAAGMLLMAAFGLFAAVQWLSGLFGNTAVFHITTGSIVALIGSLLVFTLTFALLFKFLPPVRLRWRHVWLAAVLCAIAWVITTEILALYGAYFGSLSAPGVIGGLLAITLWLNLVSQMLFFGAELCKVVASRDGQVVRGAGVVKPPGSAPAPRVERRRVGAPRRRVG